MALGIGPIHPTACLHNQLGAAQAHDKRTPGIAVMRCANLLNDAIADRFRRELIGKVQAFEGGKSPITPRLGVVQNLCGV